MSLHVSVVSDHRQVFINNTMSLHFDTKLNGTMDPLLVALSSRCFFLSKRFLLDYNVQIYKTC
jgi:hypothetical protein